MNCANHSAGSDGGGCTKTVWLGPRDTAASDYIEHTHYTYHKTTIALRHGTGAIYPAILRAQDTDERACNQQRRHGSVCSTLFSIKQS